MDLITTGEHAQISKRLAALKANRSIISTRIAEARAHGDLSENAEYHTAKEQQGLEEAEIRRLGARLESAQVVDENKAKGTGIVFLGSLVRLRDVETKEEDLFKLVGEFSDEPPDDYDEVTASSPMGEALMKSRVGETVRFNAPRGVKRFEILELL
ncbi:MAG: transcription elongation factor GreA [Planctomycetes bacterium]|nr:transcription elongation factor GreA [Planctomycetota bacterium]